MTIYPILFIIFLSIMWTRSAISLGKPIQINFLYCMAWTSVSVVLLYLCGFFNAFHWPQITWICLTTVGCVTALYRHGETFENSSGSFLFTLMLSSFIYIKGGAFQYLNN